MRIVHYYRNAIAEPSGVTAAILAWQRATQQAGVETVVVHDGCGPATWPNQALAVPHTGGGRGLSVARRNFLRVGDLLYLHEGWTTANIRAARFAEHAGVPYVVMPHGVLEPPIVASLKPPLGPRKALERRLLERAAAVHLFFDSERPLLHALAPTATAMVLPTGFDVSEVRHSGEGGYVAWYGRYTMDHKGLDRLLLALATLPREERPDVRLHGYDYAGGEAQLVNLARTLDLTSSVAIGGRVAGTEKAALLRDAACYVHPSRWESHSISLLEALAAGTPVLASASMRIAPDLAASRAATLVDFSDPVGSSRFLARSRLDALRRTNGRRYVEERLAWSGITPRLLAHLERMRGWNE
jgi:glycosyltransferase involved in cell wall biosynthesis